jgi:putative flippase GtrA
MADEQPVSEPKKKKGKLNKNIWLELIRFGVVGVVATLVDYFCQIGVLSIPGVNNWPGSWNLVFAYSVGFMVSTVVNYFLSLIWVFQNVDEKKEKDAKSQKGWWIFVLLGVGGFFLGLGLQQLGNLICLRAWSIQIADVKLSNLTQQGTSVFWAFTIVFVLKTCVTLVYNYLTRKLILFKAPKEEKKAE